MDKALDHKIASFALDHKIASFAYDPKKTEDRIYKFWEEKGYFKADPNSSKEKYSLLMPPPNLTGELHMGHAMQHSILDALARFKRMQGFDVLLLPGVDHAGIQFESTLEKKLSKEGLSKHKLGREKWLEEAWKFKDEVYNSVHKTWTFMGISADWDREVFTLDPKVQKSVFEEFKRFWDDDLLYKGAYIVQWCPKDQTAIEDLEMEYDERKEKLYFVKYEIEGKPGEYITVATTRPETIFVDVAIAIYPNHPKYKKFLGRKAINPLNDMLLKIIEDKRVDKKFGTGALKITPAHDLLDYAIGKENNLPLNYQVVDKTGRMTDFAFLKYQDHNDSLSGEKISDAKEKVIEWLMENKKIEKEDDYIHSVPVCERCKTVVQPLISEEWFLRIEPLKNAGLKLIDKINFAPKTYRKILSDWLKDAHDWSISRSLWWGHRIPVWYCNNCNPNHQVGKDKDMLVSLEKPNAKCKTCGKSDWKEDNQVLDTWFSSGLWPFSTLGWPDETKELKRYFPWDFEITAPEIKYLWIARMIMLSAYFKKEIPFRNMFFHGMMRDIQGRKFSKSLGNGIDPNELRNQWGTDSLRMTLYSYSAPGRDSNVSRQTMNERAKNYRNFNNKVWNIARFILQNTEGEKLENGFPERNKFDETLRVERQALLEDVTEDMENFRFYLAAEKLYHYTWHTLADKIIEESKVILEKGSPEERARRKQFLIHTLDKILKALHPFMPFITEEIYQKLNAGESIMISKWPE